MFSKILGVIWIILGVLWLVKPEILKNRLKRKMNRKLRWIIYGFILMFGLLLIGAVLKAEGVLPKVIGLIGIVITVKAAFLFMSRTSEKMITWLAERSLLFFRTWAIFILVTGLMLFFV